MLYMAHMHVEQCVSAAEACSALNISRGIRGAGSTKARVYPLMLQQDTFGLCKLSWKSVEGNVSMLFAKQEYPSLVHDVPYYVGINCCVVIQSISD